LELLRSDDRRADLAPSLAFPFQFPASLSIVYINGIAQRRLTPSPPPDLDRLLFIPDRQGKARQLEAAA
jgi:hypothetical protein